MKKVFLLLAVGVAAMMLSLSAFAGTSSAVFAYSGSQAANLVLDGNSVASGFSGWYDQTGYHYSLNPNYIAGVCGSSDGCNGNDLNQHDFFVFSIPTGTYSSATLSIFNPAGNGFICPCGSLTYTNWDVSTAIGTLEADNSGQIGIYNDLGSGIGYGSVVVTAASDGTYVNITLNSAALAAINLAAGGDFAIGGAVNSSIPEPGTLALLGSAVVAGAGFLRRKLS